MTRWPETLPPDESADLGLWDHPGRDDVASDMKNDPDRTDLRSAVGEYASLVMFPADARESIAVAKRRDAPMRSWPSCDSSIRAPPLVNPIEF